MKSKKLFHPYWLVAAMATTLLAGCGGSNDKPAASADNTPADNTASNDAADAPAADTPDTTPAEDTADDAAPVEELQTLKVAAALRGGYSADM